MTHKSDSRTRTRTRTRSGCSRHRTQSSTGICAACLRERLSTVEPSDDPDLKESSFPIIPALTENPAGNGACRARRSNAAGDSSSSSSFAPDLRRCRSVSASQLEAAAGGGSTEPRRRSCDVGDRNTLALLFDINDKNNPPNADTKVESKNIRFSRLAQCDEELVKDAEIGEEIRVPVNTLPPNVEAANDDDASMEGELKTMKEFIDLEIQSKSQKPKDLKDIAGNFWEAASVFSKKLRKWRQKQTAKKPGNGDGKRVYRDSNDVLPARKGKQKGEILRESQSDIGENAMGRRSWDTEPRFSVDAGRLSVENPKIIMDEPRASWDGGYLVARNIPKIPPRLSVSDSMMLGGDTISDCNSLSIDGQMHSIMEDESSSGGSGQSNSDSSYSQRESSFDRSSSVWSFDRKGLGLECDESKSASLKLVITERELRDWHLKSVKDHCVEKAESFAQEATAVEAGKRFNVSKKSTRWKKVCNVFGFKQKQCVSKGENLAGESMNTKCSVHDNSEKPKREITKITKPFVEAKEHKGVRLTRSNSSIVRGRSSIDKTEMIPSRKSVSEGVGYANTARFVPERNRNGRCTSGHLDNGVLPFYLMPLRSSRSKNSRSMLLNSDCISQNVLN